MQGKIIKSLSGFYEVHTDEAVYRCRARGVFRSLGIKPLVGDNCSFDVTDTVSVPMEGSITEILPRRNQLQRPNVANIDQALLIFSITHPVPSYNMLDRFLITMKETDLPAILCFSKADLALDEEKEELREIYEECGCSVVFMSNFDAAGVEKLRGYLDGKTTVFTGPSGVGKSTLINALCPGAEIETGELSRKIQRGKNTTRHIEIFSAGRGTYVCDTPGFTSLFLENTDAAELKSFYPEFDQFAANCRFNGCMHMKEPDCAVKRAVEDHEISSIRYNNYRQLYAELKDRKQVYRRKEN